MASDDKKTKATPAPKSETEVKKAVAEKKKERFSRRQGALDADPSKAEGSEKATDLPSNYSRGEGQKPVSKAYKDNWNTIYAKKEETIVGSLEQVGHLFE